MMALITPLFLVALSAGLFWAYLNPTYQQIQALQATTAKYADAIDRSNELIDARDELVKKNNALSDADKEKLLKLLPDHVDTVRLILDMNGIGSNYGLTLSGVTVSVEDARPGEIVDATAVPYKTVEMGFTVRATYATFRQFLKALETSLRLADVHSVSFTAPDEKGVHSFSVSLTTYWLNHNK